MATRKRNGSNGHHRAAASIERESRELECKLSDAEFQARSDQMAACELDIEKLKEQRKGINGKIADAASERGRLAHIIDTRIEVRSVECAWQDDFPKNVKRLIRQDTGAEVDTRPMQAQDRQATLDLPPVDAEPVAAAPAPAAARKRGRPKKAPPEIHAH